MRVELGSQGLPPEVLNSINTSAQAFAGSLEGTHNLIAGFNSFASRFLPRRVVEIVSEKSLGSINKTVEDRFDSRLPLFVMTHADQIVDPTQKAQYVRWMCLQTAEALIGQTGNTQYEQVSQSLTLAARRAILMGVRSTKDTEGIEIDPDWLRNLIQHTINPWTDPDAASVLRNQFINNPPKLGSGESEA